MGIEKQKFSNNAATVLSDAITNVDTSISVVNGSVFPSLSTDEYFYLTMIGYDVNGNENAWEIVKVAARSVNLLTVVRGQDGTTAQSWPQATRVELRLNAGTMSEIVSASSSSITTISYDSRGDLRSIDGSVGSVAIIDGLGLFQWVPGSDEPDDDESCFATSNGRWLLEAVHWDVVDAWQAPDWDESQSTEEDLRISVDNLQTEVDNLQTEVDSLFLTTTFLQSISSAAAKTTTSFTVTVAGAAVGDAVVITRSDRYTSPQGTVFGCVTAADTVTIYLGAYDVAAYFHVGTWRVTVIKQ